MRILSRINNGGSLRSVLATIINVLVSVFLLIWGAGQLFPLYYLFNNSVKSQSEIMRTPMQLPEQIQFENWTGAWNLTNNLTLGNFMLNSVIVVGIALSLNILVSALAAYGLERYGFPGKRAVNVLLLLSLAVPIHSLIIPLWIFFRDLGLRNSLFWLAILYCVTRLAFSTLILRAYFSSFPRELEDAARVDGASDLVIFWRIVIPISRGALASVAALNVIGMWNELLLALVMLDQTAMRTIPLSLLFFQGEYSNDLERIFAAMAILVVPTILFYILFQDKITKGMTAGALK